MSHDPTDAFEVLGGVLAKVKDVIGDGASQAMLHYAAVSEGKRLAGAHDGSLSDLLDDLSALVGPGVQVEEERPEFVRISIPDSPLLRIGEPVLDGMLTGLIEGLLSKRHRLKYNANVTRTKNGTSVAVVELKPERAVPGAGT